MAHEFRDKRDLWGWSHLEFHELLHIEVLQLGLEGEGRFEQAGGSYRCGAQVASSMVSLWHREDTCYYRGLLWWVDY